MIYVIGDSHTQAFNDSFIKIWLNAPTAYQNIKRVSEIDYALMKYEIDKLNDTLFFVFGEIDVRCHLGFIADNSGRSYEDVISECVERYGIFLDYYINSGFNVGVYGVIPSDPNNGIQGNGVPSYKTKDERNSLTKLFNSKLNTMCISNGITYKSIFDTIIGDYDNYGSYHSNDGIHLNAGPFNTHHNQVNCEALVKNLFNEML